MSRASTRTQLGSPSNYVNNEYPSGQLVLRDMQRFLLPKWPTEIAFFTTASMLILLFASGCDPKVDVFRPSDQHRYSLFGALNVAADTQVIRVSPIDDTTQVGAPSNLPVTVFLENLNTGERVPLQDSLTTLIRGRRTIQAHNFWTTYQILPATSYRVTVQKDGETITSATTTTPAGPPVLDRDNEFLLPCVFPKDCDDNRERREMNTFHVAVQNVRHVAEASVIYPITRALPGDTLRLRHEFDHYKDVEDRGSFFEISVFYRPALVNIDPGTAPVQTCASRRDFTHPYALVAVAAGGPTWPKNWRGEPLDLVAQPDTFSNVRGGHGFVGGVYSDTIKVPITERRPPFC